MVFVINWPLQICQRFGHYFKRIMPIYRGSYVKLMLGEYNLQNIQLHLFIISNEHFEFFVPELWRLLGYHYRVFLKSKSYSPNGFLIWAQTCIGIFRKLLIWITLLLLLFNFPKSIEYFLLPWVLALLWWGF